MFEDALRRFDRRTAEMREESQKEICRIEKQTIEMKSEIHKTITQIVNRNTLATITILSGLMAMFTFFAHFYR